MEKQLTGFLAFVTFFAVFNNDAQSQKNDASGPLSCYVYGREKTTLSKDALISICRCSGTTQPIDCYLRAKEETTLTETQRLQLCTPYYSSQSGLCLSEEQFRRELEID